MKTLKTLLISAIILFTFKTSFSQNITADTTLANVYYKIAGDFRKAFELDSALFYLEKAQPLYQKHLGEKSLKNANCLYTIGVVYYYASMYDNALEYWLKLLEIDLALLGEKSTSVASSYNNIGLIYSYKSEYDKALEYHFKSLEIKLELLGEKNTDVAASYNNIGLVYYYKSEYDKSLEYYLKSLVIRLELFGEKNGDVAASYNNIGNVYSAKSEYDKALEYYFKSLEIRKELFSEKNADVSGSYNNIGNVYSDKSEYDKALEYHFKSLEIRKELFGEKHVDVTMSYNNIGNVYSDKSEYDKALEYYFKSLEIRKELFGEKHTHVANSYNNIGVVYEDKSEYDKALEYHFKSLEIFLELLGEKHTFVAKSYYNIGIVYSDKSEYDKALEYYQKGIAASLKKFNNTVNVYSVPEIKNYLDWKYLLKALQAKAKILADTTKNLVINPRGFQNPEGLSRLEIALKHYQACDTLISIARKEITTQSDKIALGEKAAEVYKGAVEVCFQLCQSYKEQSFYFSERNKASVLLEALAGSDALKFAGIPQELLDKEHTLNIDIASYTNLKNSAENDSIANIWSDKLFDSNRTYDSLIVKFETDYPEYYQLKYNNLPVKVEQIQEILDNKTAMLSYFVLDSSIVIYAISKKAFEIYKVAKIEDFKTEIGNYYYAIQSSKNASVQEYKDLAFKFYNQLFSEELQSFLANTKTENLIIIPDGILSTIPFESLLTEDYKKDFTTWADKTYFSEMPYLIKKYAISYSYSATLFYNTFPKENTKNVEIKNIKDFIGFAPVFDDENTAGTTLVTRKLLSDLEIFFSDSSITTRAFLRDGTFISPLPGTLTEVERIFELFNKKDYSGLIKTYKQANEDYIKSDALSHFKFIHFATHGFVNTEKPELSGILLAQDTSSTFESYEDIYGNVAQQNDGILYQSEIYNMKLNSDLVVLSACETGLGKITSGEGVIGLTRALLYAGSKNIIVSLWSVSDASTSQLMLNFYDNLLKSKKQNQFSKDLQKSKLKLIENGTYSHPFYWSPFILIGK